MTSIGPNNPRQRAGGRIKARTINRPSEQAEGLSRMQVAGAHRLDVAGIPTFAVPRDEVHVARIVSGPAADGAYAWQGVYYDTDTETWLDFSEATSDLDMADPAYPLDGGGLSVGERVLIRREPISTRWVAVRSGTLVDIKITANVGPATWGAGSLGCTAMGTGTCRLLNQDGTVGTTDYPLLSRWPDSVDATRFGKAEWKYGALHLVSASCSTVPA